MNVAMIGTGGIAAKHLSVLAAEPNIAIVGHMSPTAEHAAAAARRWGGRPYTSHAELLQRERPDAVWICVPPLAHGTLERDLIDQHIPFFVEKPLSADRLTAEQIAASISNSGLIVGVGYHWRAMDTIPYVQETIATNPPRMVIGAWHDATPPPLWWRVQALSGGQMVEQATHLFDLARLLVGEARVIGATASRQERSAYPDMDVADVSAALIQYERGAAGVFSATCLLGGAAAIHVQLVCEGLLITITQAGVTYDTGSERRELRARHDPFVAENRAFLEAVSRNDPMLLFSSYADALLTHRLCCDVLERSGYLSTMENIG
jgi:predicted dehydrogenase